MRESRAPVVPDHQTAHEQRQARQHHIHVKELDRPGARPDALDRKRGDLHVEGVAGAFGGVPAEACAHVPQQSARRDSGRPPSAKSGECWADRSNATRMNGVATGGSPPPLLHSVICPVVAIFGTPSFGSKTPSPPPPPSSKEALPRPHFTRKKISLKMIRAMRRITCWGSPDWRGAKTGPGAPPPPLAPEEAWAMAHAHKRRSAQSAGRKLAGQCAQKTSGTFVPQTVRHEDDLTCGEGTSKRSSSPWRACHNRVDCQVLTGLFFQGGKKERKGFGTPTETNVHGSLSASWSRHGQDI